MTALLKRVSFYLLTATLVSYSCLQGMAEVRKINPPKLSVEHLGTQILCYRPMREGSPQMSVSKIGDKTIAHNYGHGGSGWTLGPGSAQYVNDLLICVSPSLHKDSLITIVGAGAIGLFAAYDLIERGYTNLRILAQEFDNLTSHNAGGLLAPVSMHNAPEIQKLINSMGFEAYRFYADIAQGLNCNLPQGAIIVPTYFATREDSGLEPYVGTVMAPAKDVVLDFGNGTQRAMVAYDDGIFIDTGILMDALREYLMDQGVSFVQETVRELSTVDSTFIINCTGLAGGTLNDDSEMVSVQGHLWMLKDQNPADLQHMILVYFGEDTTESGQAIKRSFYMFPKHLPGSADNDIGVIGGTFVKGATPATPNFEEFAIMLQGAKDFYGIRE